MKSRILFVFIMICFLWAVLILRSAYLQIMPNEKLSRLHSKQFNTVIELNPRRGIIYDRNGVELAASVAAHSLYADPSLVKSPKYVARRLAPKLNIPFNKLYDKLKDPSRRFIWLARRLDIRQRTEIEKMDFAGLAFVEESRRIFPNEKLLSHVLGFVGGEGQGLEGIEAKFEDSLHGFKRRVSMNRDALGRPLIVNGRLFRESSDGADLTLTIDSELQYALEQELEEVFKEQNAKGAVGIILDAKSSEILSMAAAPQFNPNTPLSYPQEVRRNRAVTDPFEPGSTMKTFTIAAALSEGTAAPNTKIYCEKGELKIGDRTIREADKKHKFEWLSLSEIIAYSSNVGSSKIALNLGDKRIYQTLRDFGFGEKTGIEILGESKGILPQLPWRDHLLANISFGHGIAATPLQIANAYAAIANGGILNRPYIVKNIRNKESGDIEEFEAQAVRRVLSEKDSATMRLMLMGVTGEGATGFRARIRGFPVAGKTGTAQKVDAGGGYSNKNYLSSFVGFVPANDPKYVIFIAIDEPQTTYYGSEVAAPVFGKLAALSARRAGLQPTLISQENVLKRTVETTSSNAIIRNFAVSEDIQQSIVPSVEGLTLREAMRLLRSNGIDVEFTGKGRVSSMEPPPGFPLSKAQKVRLTLRE